jgi:hypothetical protein
MAAPLSPTPLSIALRRLELTSYAIQEVHTELSNPEDPEHKADLLLATEQLVLEALDLYQTVKTYAWGETPTPEIENDDYQ